VRVVENRRLKRPPSVARHSSTRATPEARTPAGPLSAADQRTVIVGLRVNAGSGRFAKRTGLDRARAQWRRIPPRYRTWVPFLILFGLAITYPFYVTHVPTNTVVAPWAPSLTVDTTGWPPGDYLFRLDSPVGQRYVPLTLRTPSNAGRLVIVNDVTERKLLDEKQQRE